MINIPYLSTLVSTGTVFERDIHNICIDLENVYQFSEKESQYLSTCANNLISIGEALHVFEKEHGNFPEWLSDLHPIYLPNADIIVCPADEDRGVSLIPYDTDPKFPVSYSYDCTPEYYEQWLKHERHVYGDANPIIRCSHHANSEADSNLVSNLYLNLSFSQTLSFTDSFWRKYPVRVYGSLEAAITGYERALQLVPEDLNFFQLYPELVTLYVESGRESDAENLIERFRYIMKPDESLMRFRDYWTLVDMLKRLNRHDKALKLLQNLEKTEQENPFISSIYREIAMIHEERGNTELANSYSVKSDSRLKMIGEPTPDFTATDIDGNQISPKDYLGKVVLIDFWSTTCSPCIAEMTNVIKVYKAFNDMGFEVIGISLDEDEARLNEFLNECKLPWRQIFTGEGWETPIRKLYKVKGIPSPWLIDREGKVISFNARGRELRKLVSEAIHEEN